jgi:prepilin-type N-terminal cleavage/methylation domain-containing protein
MRTQHQSGFSLLEMIIVMTLMLSLLGFITINLVKSQRSVTINTTIDTLIGDMRSQQIKAMTGETEARTNADVYGVYFTSSNYVLFHGLSYNASDTDNLTIPLDTEFTFNNPGKTIIFSRITGNVSGYSALQNTITISDSTNNQQKILRYNGYGAITAVN